MFRISVCASRRAVRKAFNRFAGISVVALQTPNARELTARVPDIVGVINQLELEIW